MSQRSFLSVVSEIQTEHNLPEICLLFGQEDKDKPLLARELSSLWSGRYWQNTVSLELSFLRSGNYRQNAVGLVCCPGVTDRRVGTAF